MEDSVGKLEVDIIGVHARSPSYDSSQSEREEACIGYCQPHEPAELTPASCPLATIQCSGEMRLHPISRLPFEMLARCLLFVILSEHSLSYHSLDRAALRLRRSSQLPLMLVCKHWRDVVCSSPALWRDVVYHVPAELDGATEVELCADRAPFVRHLDSMIRILLWVEVDCILGLLKYLSKQNMSQLNTLSLVGDIRPGSTDCVALNMDCIRFHGLREIVLFDVFLLPYCLVTPSTTCLEIIFTVNELNYAPRRGALQQLLDVLERAPGLEGLKIRNYLPKNWDDDPMENRIITWKHPGPKTVELEGVAEGMACFLNHLMLSIAHTEINLFCWGHDINEYEDICDVVGDLLCSSAPLVRLDLHFLCLIRPDGHDDIKISLYAKGATRPRLTITFYTPRCFSLQHPLQLALTHLSLRDVESVRVYSRWDLLESTWMPILFLLPSLSALTVQCVPTAMLCIMGSQTPLSSWGISPLDHDDEDLLTLSTMTIDCGTFSPEDRRRLVLEMQKCLEEREDAFELLHLHNADMTVEEEEILGELVNLCTDGHCQEVQGSQDGSED